MSGYLGGGLQSVMIAVIASILFPIDHIPNKSFQVVAILVDHPQIYLPGIGLQGFLASETFRKGVDVVSVKKSHDFQISRSEGFNRVYRAGSTAYVQ